MRKTQVGLLVAGLMLMQSMTVFAANSPGTGPVIVPDRDHGSSSSSSAPTYREMTTNDAAVLPGVAGLGGTVGTGAGGTGGASSSADGGGSITIGNTKVSFAVGKALTAGLSAQVTETVEEINSGTRPLYQAIGTPLAVGYSALTPIQSIIATDITTQTAATAPVSLTFYIPNLMQGLNNIQILYYNQTSKSWEMMAPTAIDFATKQVTVGLPGSTPFTIVYKRK
ncbi:MAG: hypothetical protein RR768_10790 [Clostridium sp.]